MAESIKTSSNAGAQVQGVHHRPLGLLPRRATCISAVLALAGLTCAAPEAHAATAFWYGTSGTLWSTATNWNTVATGTGSYTLVNGDSLRWFSSSTNNRTSYNDLTGLSVAGLSFQGSTGAFTLNGNKLTLTSGFTQLPSGLTVNMPLELNLGTFTIDSGTNTTLNGVISEIGGSRGFQLSVGRVTLTGSNTFSGQVLLGVSSGTSTVVVNNLANIGVAQPLGTGTNLQLGWTSGVGELIYNGSSDVSTDKRVIVGRDANGTGAVIRNNGSGVMTWNGALQGTTGAKTFTLGGSNTGTNTWASAIVNGASGTNSFTKEDAGR